MKRAFLQVQNGELIGQSCAIRAASLVVGRADDCDLNLNGYQRVSRRHARLDFDGQSLFISDEGSTNGVLLNGVKVMRAALKNGDRLELGDFSAVVRLENGAQKPGAALSLSQE